MRRVVEAGESAWTIHDPLRNSYFRHDALTHDLCELLDGGAAPTAVRTSLERRFPSTTSPRPGSRSWSANSGAAASSRTRSR